MTRDEFWSLHPTEFWWLVDAHTPKKMYLNMSEDEVREIYEEAYGTGE